MTPEEYIERNSFESWGENVCVFASDAYKAVDMARYEVIDKLAKMPLDELVEYLKEELIKIKSDERV